MVIVSFLYVHSKKYLTFSFRLDLFSDEVYYSSNENLMYVTGLLLYLNSTINPVIYNLISAKYRKAFKETLFNPSTCCR